MRAKELRAKDVMTSDVVVVTVSTTINALCKILAEHDITGVPVVDESGRIVGVVSETDVLLSQVASRVGNTAHADVYDLFGPSYEFGWEEPRSPRQARWVEDIMSRKVITAPEDTPVPELCSIMTSHGIHRIPIVRDGMLVGIVTTLDLLKALIAED